MRDAQANNLAEVLDLSQAPRIEDDSEPPEIPIALSGLGCSQNVILEETDGENPLAPLPDVPAPPFARPRGTPTVATAIEEPHKEWRELADAGFFGPFDFRERAKQGVFRD